MTKVLAAVALSCLVGLAQAEAQASPGAADGAAPPTNAQPEKAAGGAKGARATKAAPAKRKGADPAGGARGEKKAPQPQGVAAEKPCEPVKPCPID
jgi:hypothetical protein